MKYLFSLVCAVLLSLSAFSQSYIYFSQGGGSSRNTSYGYGTQLTNSAPAWVIASPGTFVLQWTVMANTGTSMRSATLTGQEKDSNGKLTGFTVQITQSGATTAPPSNPCANFAISGPVSLTPGINTYYFNIPTTAGTGTWSITGGGPATITSGQGTNTVGVNTDPNTSNGIQLSVITTKGCGATFFCIPL